MLTLIQPEKIMVEKAQFFLYINRNEGIKIGRGKAQEVHCLVKMSVVHGNRKSICERSRVLPAPTPWPFGSVLPRDGLSSSTPLLYPCLSPLASAPRRGLSLLLSLPASCLVQCDPVNHSSGLPCPCPPTLSGSLLLTD